MPAATDAEALASWAAAHAASLRPARQPGTARLPDGSTGAVGGVDAAGARPARVVGLTEELRWGRMSGSVSCLAWGKHPDGRQLLAAVGDASGRPGADTSARLQIVDLGAGLRLAFNGSLSARGAVAWGRIGDRLMLACGSAVVMHESGAFPDGLLFRAFPDTYNSPGLPGGPVAWATAADGSPLLATGSPDGAARISHPQNYASRLGDLPGLPSFALAAVHGHDGVNRLATGRQGNTVQVWDLDSHSVIHQGVFGHPDATSYPMTAMAYGVRADGQTLLATTGRHRPRIWTETADGGLTARELDAGGLWVDDLCWVSLPDGRMLLAGCGLGILRIWDGWTLDPLYTRAFDAHADVSPASIAWEPAPDGQLRLAAGHQDGLVQIWAVELDPPVAAQATASNAPLTMTRAIPGEPPGPVPDVWAGPVRVWLVEAVAADGSDEDDEDKAIAASGTIAWRAFDRWLLRLGGGGLWPPAGLTADLVTLTAPSPTGPGLPPADGQADGHRRLRDPGLAPLADEPGVERLRALAAGEPPWRADARVAFAGLLTRTLEIPERYVPPAEATTAELRTALAAAIATDGQPASLTTASLTTASPSTVPLAPAIPTPSSAPASPAASWHAPVGELRTAAGMITEQVIALLAILGPDACAADPALPLRLAGEAAWLPVLSPSELRLLAALGADPSSVTASVTNGTGTLAWSPGSVGVARGGPLTRLLPGQLALPRDLLAIRLAEDQLLYRQHRSPVPPAPEPVTVILDATPPTYGPAGTALRLAAHLITTTLWAHGRHPVLVTLAEPQAATELRGPADLLRIWTAGTLEDPAVTLAAARRTAESTGQPAVLCTHFQTAREHGWRPGPVTRLLTAHQPPETAPPAPAGRWHAHLPPGPGQALLAAAVGRLLVPASEAG
jgi:WD40 repeat protein